MHLVDRVLNKNGYVHDPKRSRKHVHAVGVGCLVLTDHNMILIQCRLNSQLIQVNGLTTFTLLSFK